VADHTLNASQQFPPGSTVGVYAFPASGQINYDAAPATSAIDTDTMNDTSVTFQGLTNGTTYIAYAVVNSQKRYATFTVGADADTGNLSDGANETITGDWEFQGAVEFSGDVTCTGTLDLPADSVVKADLADDSVGKNELDVTLAAVTVSAGNPSGTATVVSGSVILGYYPTSNQDQHVDSIAISGTTLTVTLAAAATADNTFKVVCLKA